ncbi:PREDICTED: uncharacterized protein LOC109151135 [Ipomoea nil]|uniref:uncharacterized protein LOC109151135 n=1 Tax=Ipomoea nil TaxID=35883 RepID=UPI000900F7C0|nr:PREDICTED: uncharacterized protein LOC109151135 [Ipomoea nil]
MTDTEVVDADKRDASNNDDDVTMVRRRRISPHDLSPSDNPGMLLTQVVLKGDNYDEWSKSMRLALRARKKFGFVDGSIPLPVPTSDDVDDWWTNHSLLVSWIRNTIGPTLRSTISHVELASTLWDDLKARFSIINGLRVQQLKRELTEVKQRGLTIMAYYDKKHEEERVHQFLMGLDEGEYSSIRSQLLSLEPLPTMSRVYNILVQEETARVTVCGTKGGTSDAAVFATIKEITCTNCKKPGRNGERGGRGGGRGSNRGGGRAGRNDGRGIFGQHPSGQVTTHAATADASFTAFPDFDNLTPEQWNAVRHALSLSPTGSTLNESLSANRPLYHWFARWKPGYISDQERCNLISVSQLTKDSKCEARFTDKSCVLQDLKTTIGVGEYREGFYYFKQDGKEKAFNAVKEHSFDLWHKCLGHPSSRVLSFVPLAGSIKNSCLANNFCEICVRAKQSRASFPISIHNSSGIFDMVHCDLWGPYKTPSLNGSTFFLTIVDNHSRGVRVYLLQSKRDVVPMFQQFCALVTRQFEKYVKCVRSDNGTEFEGLKEYFRTHGIIYKTSCVSTPQQNGRVERKHRHILNVARALRFQASLSIKFWGECFVHNQKRHGDKFAERSIPGIFLGYPPSQKRWHVYCSDTGKIIVSRDVIFSENVFPFTQETEADSESPPPNQDNLIPEEEEECVDSVRPVPGARTPAEPATQTNDLPVGGTTTGRDEVAVSEVPVPVLVDPSLDQVADPDAQGRGR